MPICPNCRYNNPDGAANCYLCGAQLKTLSPTYTDHYSRYADHSGYDPTPKRTYVDQNTYDNEPFSTYTSSPAYQPSIGSDILGKWDKKEVACLLGIIMVFFGFFASWYTFIVFYFEPLIFIIFIYLTIALPLIGTILIAIGKFTDGGILLGIGSVLMIPIGLLGIFGARIGIRLGRAKKFYQVQKQQLGSQFVNPFTGPSKVALASVIIFIIIILIIPGIFYFNYVSQPQLKIDDFNAPAYIYGDTVDVDVKLLNVGNEKAKGDEIEIKIVLNRGTQTFKWKAGDILSRDKVKDTFSLNAFSGIKINKVTVYYKGHESHTIYYE